jgi:hypothetical protein
MFVGAASLSAVQFLPGWITSGETVRATGLSYEVASTFNFPPENLITMFAPAFFGGYAGAEYWGDWDFWEMNAAIGTGGLLLLALGLVFSSVRERWILGGVAGTAFVLALGTATPIYDLLYRFLPGFSRFRGVSKFIFLAVVIALPLAGRGLDLVRSGHSPRLARLARVTGILSLVFLLLGVAIGRSSARPNGGLWAEWIRAGARETPTELVAETGRTASRSLVVGGGVLVTSAALFAIGRRRRNLGATLLAVLVVLEAFLFARAARPVYSLQSERGGEEELRNLLEEIRPGQDRIYFSMVPNVAMAVGSPGIWGRDPMIMKRYAELLAFTQGEEPDQVTQNLRLHQYHRVLTMVRWAYDLRTKDPEGLTITGLPEPMERFQVIRDYRVLGSRDAMFAAMDDPQFDPRRTVLLESEPEVARLGNGAATIEIEGESSDHVDLAIALDSPGILLVTDAFARGWRARSLVPSAEEQYDVLPANHAIMAVPLTAGNHRLRLEYRPPAFGVGATLTGLTASALLLFLVASLRGMHTAGRAQR